MKISALNFYFCYFLAWHIDLMKSLVFQGRHFRELIIICQCHSMQKMKTVVPFILFRTFQRLKWSVIFYSRNLRTFIKVFVKIKDILSLQHNLRNFFLTNFLSVGVFGMLKVCICFLYNIFFFSL